MGRFLIFTHFCAVLIMVSGCSLSIGGARFCFLDHADLAVTTHHQHADPNGPH